MREQDLAERVRRPDDRAAGDGPGKRAEAAHHDDDERVDERVHIHPRLHAEDGSRDDPGEARERRPDREGAREEAVGIHAQRGQHLGVEDPCPNERTDAGAPVQHIQKECEGRAESDDEQPVGRVIAAGDHDRAVQAGREWQRPHGRAPAPIVAQPDEVDDHERQPDGDEDLVKVPAADPSEQERLDDRSDGREHERRHDERDPE